MKKQLLLFFILAANIFSFSSAQNSFKLKAKNNSYQAGDSIYKYQVEYKDPGSTGRELDWDFTFLNPIDEHYLIKYFYPDKNDTNRICGMEHRTRYYYCQQNDSLWATGFENYTTMLNYTIPELKLKFPFNYGDTLYSTFEGEGMYSNMLKLKVKGWTRVEADAEGELKLPDGITVPNALRTHTTRYYTQTGKDSVQMALDTYTWYAQGIRYPVFESIKTSLYKLSTSTQDSTNTEEGKILSDTTIFYTSFYYSPTELKEISDSIKENSTDEYGNTLSEAEKVFTEAAMLPNPVISNLNIDYKLTRKAVIWFSVHNNIGIPMRQTTPQTLDEGYHQTQIYMGNLVTGTYTVYVHVDDMVIQRVVVKK